MYPFAISDPSQDGSDLHEMITASQTGDARTRELIIRKYTPFVYKVAAKVSGKFIGPSNDEASIGLIALNEAIDHYDLQKGANFFTFAEVVIKRRIIDYYRKEQRAARFVPAEAEDLTTFEYKESDRIYKEQQEAQARREEMLLFHAKLKDYGISIHELAKISPKHEDARIRAMEVAQIIAKDNFLKDYLLTKKTLPLKALEPQVEISRKTLERQRKYVIALTILLIFEFPILKEHIRFLVERGRHSV